MIRSEAKRDNRRGSDINAIKSFSSTSSGTSILARDVSKSYRGSRVLSDVSLSIKQGEFVAIVGPSGCGKSTLLRMLAGLEQPSTGSISFGEGSIDRHRTACVFQEPALLPWRTVADNISLPLELLHMPTTERRQRVQQCLPLIGLTANDAEKLPRQLSGGMRMRVSLARALVTEPQLLLLDEPFAAIDDLLRQRLNEDLHQLWREQRWTTAFVTHNVAEAVFLADRVLIMAAQPGRIVAEIAVPFSSPRDFALRSSALFARTVAEIGQRLRGIAHPVDAVS